MRENVNGWVKLPRGIMKSVIWPKDRFTSLEFWIYLLLKSNYENHFVYWREKQIKVLKGQVLTSIGHLCRDSHRCKKWVVKKLREFAEAGMIRCQNRYGFYTCINICDYIDCNDTALLEEPTGETALEPGVGPTEGPHTIKIKKEKKEKKYIYGDFASQINEIIEYYNTTIKPLKKLSPNRISMVTNRLKIFSVAECKKAIDNVNASPFHSGHNEEGKIYKDFDMIFKTDEQLEKYLNLKSGMENKKNARPRWYADCLDRKKN